MRRYVAERTIKNKMGERLQVVTVYPTAINKKQMEKELGIYSAEKYLLVKDKNNWRIDEL